MSDIQVALQSARTWAPDSGAELNTTGKIRHRFFEGESLTADEVANAYGVSNGMLGTTANQLKLLGYTFDESKVDGKKTWRMTNPEHEPTYEQIDHMRQVNSETRDKKKAQSAAKKKKQPRGGSREVAKPEPVPMPVFGSFVEVYLMHANGNGEVTLGLRDEATSWMVTVTAGAARSAE